MVGDGSHRGGNSVSQRGGVGGVAEVLGVSVSLCLSGRGSASEGQEARQSNCLHHDIVMTALPQTGGSVSLANWYFAATWFLGFSIPQRIILVLWSMFFVVVLLSLSLNVF
jgi:hypothetical protein